MSTQKEVLAPFDRAAAECDRIIRSWALGGTPTKMDLLLARVMLRRFVTELEPLLDAIVMRHPELASRRKDILGSTKEGLFLGWDQRAMVNRFSRLSEGAVHVASYLRAGRALNAPLLVSHAVHNHGDTILVSDSQVGGISLGRNSRATGTIRSRSTTASAKTSKTAASKTRRKKSPSR